MNPRLDLGGEFVGTFPELVGCRAARFDIDGDGSIDDVCGGFRVDTEPEFGVVDFGFRNPTQDDVDVHPAPGLEHREGCQILGQETVALDLGPAPCDTAGRGFTDIDDDGDFDVVMKDGRVFLQSDEGLLPGEPLPPVPGAVTRFRFGDDGRELVAFDEQRRVLVRFHNGAWVEAGAFGSAIIPEALFELDDGAHQTLVIWHLFITPNVTLCSWTGTTFACHVAASTASVVATPPRDGRFSSTASVTRVAADGHELSDGLAYQLDFSRLLEEALFGPQENSVVALSNESVWFVDKANADVFKRSLQPQSVIPATVRVHRGDAIVDVRVDNGALVVGDEALPLPSTPRLVVAHPTAPVLWLILMRWPTHNTELVMALNVETSEVITEAELAYLGGGGVAQLQFVSNNDGLELRCGGSVPVAFDATTGAPLADGAQLLPTLDEGHGVVDLDGDGVADGMLNVGSVGRGGGVISTASGTVNVGEASAVFGGPGRRQVSIYNTYSGAITWDLLCD